MKIVWQARVMFCLLLVAGCGGNCLEEHSNPFALRTVQSEADLCHFYFVEHTCGCTIRYLETSNGRWMFAGVRTSSGIKRCEVLCFKRAERNWELKAVGFIEGLVDSELQFRSVGSIIEIANTDKSKVLMNVLNK